MLTHLALSLVLAAADPEATVVIGDSQAEGLKNAGELTALGVAIHAFRGQTIAFFQSWLTDHPAVVRDKALIVFQLGGNDVTRGRDADDIVHDLSWLAGLAHMINPQAEIVFGLIPVRGQWFDAQQRQRPQRQIERLEQTLNAVNTWLLQGQHAGFGVFAVNDVIADPLLPRLQRAEFRRRAADVHLNRRGYTALSSALAESLLAR